jgi:sec-independent protein translocase protein TatA
MPGWQEILVIALVVIVLFGGKKIPELARGLGKAMNEFKRAKSEIKDEIDKASDSTESK